MAEMTREQFEAYYAGNSRMTVEELRALGLEAQECDCGYATCLGWAMRENDAFLDFYIEDRAMRQQRERDGLN